MKKFLDVLTVILLVFFIAGLVSTALAGNWVAFIWALAATLWMLFSRQQSVWRDEDKEEYEAKLADVRRDRDEFMRLYKEYWDNYRAKVDDYEALVHENERLTALQMGAPIIVNQEPSKHGNIRLKKKKSSPKVKTETQDKTE